MSRFPGHIIKLPANTPSQSSAPGVWTLKDQLVAQRNNQWPFQRDPDFRYTTLLLQGNVPNTTGPQAMNLPLAYNSDASSNNFLITPNGDVHPKPFSPYGGGNYSLYTDSTSNYLQIPSNPALALGASDFCIEYWVYPTSTTNRVISWAAANCPIMYMESDQTLKFENYGVGSILQSVAKIPLNQWTHCAVSRASGVNRMFINGALVATTTNNQTWGQANLNIGVDISSNAANGYISNLRVVKGSPVYTAAFTPPTEALQNIPNTILLTCQSNRFIDNSTANGGTGFAITRVGTPRITDNSPFVSADFTTGSGYFDGGTDFLQVANNAAFGSLNGVDYTIEFWAFQTTTSGDQPLLACTSIGASGFAIWTLSGQLNVLFGGGTTITGATLTPNQWNHIAVVRTSTNTQLYLNGVSQGTPSTSAFVNNTAQPLMVGGLTSGTGWNSDRYVTGYISGLRIIKGQALATGNFTPPTTLPTTTTVGWTGGNVPTQSITGTVAICTLLTRAPSQNHGFIDSSPNEFIITRNGNVSQGTFSPFSPTGWGNYLNSTSGNYLSVPASNAFDVGTNNFTAELWFYINPGATSYNGWGRAHILGGAEATSSSRIAIVVNGNSLGSSGLTWSVGSTSGSYATAIAQGVWHHVALVRSGTAITLYLNGTAVSTGNSSDSIANNIQHIGAFRATDDQFSDYFYGYVSNVRFIKNQALFSGSTVGTTYFTPSTAPLTTTSVGSTGAGAAASITGTVSLLTCQSNRFLDQTGKTLTVVGSPSVQAFSPFAPANSVSPLVTGGSMYFSGSSDILSWPQNTWNNRFGSNNWSIEAWVYPLSSTATEFFVDQWTNGVTTTSIIMTFMGGNFDVYIGSTLYTLTGVTPAQNAWTHLVAVRTGGTLSIFQNGVRTHTRSDLGSGSVNNGGTANRSAPSIGRGSACYFHGHRVVIGSNVPYDATNTVIPVPTAPVTAIPGTVSLLSGTGGGIVDATGKNVIETFGNAQLTTAQPKWTGQGSLSNNGAAGARFQVSSNSAPPLFNVGTGDYTVEFWVNTGTPASQQCILDFRNADVAGQGYALIFNTSRQIIMYYNVGNRITTSAISANVWTHIAVVRYNGVYTIYVNGSASGGTYNNSDAVAPPANRPLIGSVSDGSQVFNGNFSDFRISRIARYTGNFNINTIPGPFPIG